MRIFTRIYVGGSDQPVVRGLTLFHAGKVYDYIEPAEEVTVFESALKRFTVLNKPRQLRSELTQEEIRHFLALAESEAQKQLINSQPQKSIELLQFQLLPEFTTTFESSKSEPNKSQLTMGSPHFQYVVNARAPESPDVLETYLHYADWTAQLNSVLHPQSLLPAPRMMLNQELRQRGLIPQSVDLKVDAEPPVHLEAHHEWTWNLKETDRQMILEWEKLLQSPDFRRLSFRPFQQEMLKLKPGRKR